MTKRTRRSGAEGEEEARMERVSRNLSRTLRHSAREDGLHMREDGYVCVAELLQSDKYRQLQLDFPLLQRVVAENSKKRYKMIREDTNNAATTTTTEPPLLSEASTETSLDPSVSTDPNIKRSSIVDSGDPAFDEMVPEPDLDLSKYFIRAVQGHSIPIQSSLLLTPITATTIPPTCIHGTYYTALTSILGSSGLSKMGRTHIHCAPGLPKPSIDPLTGETVPAVVSGMRFNAEVLFYIDVKKAVADGVGFWRSDNDVILTSGINEEGVLPMEYVIRVEDVGGRAGGGDLWTREEGVVKEWPAGKKKKKKNVGGGGGGRGGRGKGKGRDGKEGRSRQVDGDVDEISTEMEATRI